MSLTSSELSTMRAALLDLLPDTGTILAVTHTPDGQGGQTGPWGTATASVACRVDSVKAQETTLGGALRPYHSYMITLPYDVTIAEENRVVVGSDTFNVTSEDESKSWDIVRRVYAEKL